MASCAYMNSETLFFECFQECFFHTFCIYAEFILHVIVKIILKSGVEPFSQKLSYSAKIY